MTANDSAGFVVGVDTHADTYHVAVISENGRRIRDQRFPATGHGYADIFNFISEAPVMAVGIEGTGSYGAELARVLTGHGFTVAEVNGSNRQRRGLRGESGPLDAYEAAHSALSGRGVSMPKTGDGFVEAIREVSEPRRYRPAESPRCHGPGRRSCRGGDGDRDRAGDNAEAYVARRVNEGKMKREAIRCLKRYIAREVFRTIAGKACPEPITDLRGRRLTASLTLVAAAQNLGVWPIAIRRMEAGISRDDSLAERYLEWLHQRTGTTD